MIDKVSAILEFTIYLLYFREYLVERRIFKFLQTLLLRILLQLYKLVAPRHFRINEIQLSYDTPEIIYLTLIIIYN